MSPRADPGPARIPILGFVGCPGVGKTTLLTRLLPRLGEQGLRVGILKQAHHTFEIDHRGKDSYELRKAGALQTLIASRRRWALMVETPAGTDEPRLAALLQHLDQSRLDLILVEGFRHEPIPKVEVHRPVLGNPLFVRDDPMIIALAADRPVGQLAVPVLDLNRPRRIAEFVIRRCCPQVRERGPTLT